jgi:choline dehydrogenase-like flavoprotein
VPQQHLGDREIPIWRGKGVGGSTQTNFQVWSLGGRDEFDAWATAVGAPEWGFENILGAVRMVGVSLVCRRINAIQLRRECLILKAADDVGP